MLLFYGAPTVCGQKLLQEAVFLLGYSEFNNEF